MNCYIGLFIVGLFLGSSLARADALTDIRRSVAQAMRFPEDQLTIENYLEVEKMIYNTPNAVEFDKPNFKPLINTDHLYEAYLIKGTNILSFHPVIVTVVKRDTYNYPSLVKLTEAYNSLPDLPFEQKGRLPLGRFDLDGAVKANLILEEIRRPRTPQTVIRTDDQVDYHPVPDIKLPTTNNYPQNILAAVSIVHVADSDIDLRLAKYAGFYTPDDLIEVTGGEWYYAMFNQNSDDDPKDIPKHVAWQNLFRTLNQNIMATPTIAKYINRATEEEPPASSEPPVVPIPEAAPAPQADPPKPVFPEPNTRQNPFYWLVALPLIALLVGLFAAYRLIKQRGRSR